jgi:hypothetical protein
MRELDEALADWERYQSISLEDLLKERDLRNMVLHALADSSFLHRLPDDSLHLLRR